MSAALGNGASGQHDDLAGILDGREAVTKNEGRSAGADLLQMHQNTALRSDIDSRQCVIEDQNGRIQQQGSGDGDALLLSS